MALKRCKNASKYKGIHYPRCNNGDPCNACLKIYKEARLKLDNLHKAELGILAKPNAKLKKLMRTPAPWEISQPKKKAQTDKDRFGKDREKLKRLQQQATDAINLAHFLDSYFEFVNYSALIKKPFVTGDRPNDRLLLSAVGISSEAGELLDVFKKIYWHDKKRKTTMSKDRREKVILEAGDVFWYYSLFLQEMGVSLRDVLTANMEKLANR